MDNSRSHPSRLLNAIWNPATIAPAIGCPHLNPPATTQNPDSRQIADEPTQVNWVGRRRLADKNGIPDRYLNSVEGRGDESTNVDLGALAEQDAVRVDEIDLPVRIEVTEELGAVAVQDAVDRHGCRIGLLEIDGLVGLRIEALPVDREILATLVNGGCRTRLADGARARSHLPANRCCQRRTGTVQTRHASRDRPGSNGPTQPPGGTAPLATLGAAGTDFRYGHPLRKRRIPDQSVNAVD